MDLNKYLREQHAMNPSDCPKAKRIQCSDGLSLSVQAGWHAYCTPRENNATWLEVEVGFPSSEIPEIMRYAEESGNPTETVYGYVPIELVEQVIELHGGMVQ